MNMKRIAAITLSLSITFAAVVAPAPAMATTAAKVSETIRTFKKKDPGIKYFFDKSYAYAVFPTVGKGGIGIGGAYGSGLVYQHGRHVGSAKLTQVSIGFQLGGQAYSEVIFFQNKSAFRRFTNGNLKLGAQVSAVAVNKGAAANASFNHGIAIFTAAKGGLMYEATVAGQAFEYSHK